MRTHVDPGRARREPARRQDGAAGGSWRHAAAIGLAGLLAGLAVVGPSSPALADSRDRSGAQPAGQAGALDTSRAPVEGDWVVLQAAADATWRPQGGVRWQPVARSQVLPARSEVVAGPAGEVLLVVGGDRLVVAPHSRLILPARAVGQDQRLRLEGGRIRFDVERRRDRDVGVRTPLLSLGIKGTSIEIAVDRQQDSVLVLEGRVSVTTPGAALPQALGPGQGLRQLAASDTQADRLEVADLPPTVDRTAPVRWYLPPPAASPAVRGPAGSAVAAPVAVEHEPVNLWERSSTARASRGERGWFSAWLDHQTSLFTILLIAAGGLAVLIIPGLVLGQNLRQQWLDRPTGRGRRRRGLTRG
ncbi:MAG TPA: FecR family protein [Geminicoccaceae bacterium]|nr:FecR family protein [Geminicoccaceae bacterium]